MGWVHQQPIGGQRRKSQGALTTKPAPVTAN